MAENSSTTQHPPPRSPSPNRLQHDATKAENGSLFELTPVSRALAEGNELMSDMPDISADIDHRASCSDKQTQSSSGTRKFLSRVNGVDEDTVTSFSLLPTRPMLQPRRARSKPLIPRASSRDWQDDSIASTRDEIEDHQARSPNHITNCQSFNDSSDTNVSVATVDCDPSNINQGRPHSKGNCSESPHEVDQHGVEGQISCKDGDVNDRKSSTPEELIDKGSLEMQILEKEGCDMFNNAMSGLTSGGLSPDEGSRTHIAAALSPDSGNLYVPEVQKAMPIDISRAGTTRQGAANPVYRIQKNKTTFQHGRPKVLGPQASNGDPSSSSDSPSEEDLLYLLMHYTRKREQMQSRNHQVHDYLHKQNRDLQKAKDALEKDLEIACVERDRLLVDVGESHDELSHFKQRYKKLKAWALEMNNEYAAIRQEGSDLKKAMISLRSQNAEFWKPVKANLSSYQDSITSVTKIRNDLAKTRQSVSSLENDLQLAQKTTAEKCAELRAAKAMEAEYKSYIQQLTTLQKNFDDRTVMHQIDVKTALTTLSERINATTTETSLSKDLVECLSLMKNASDRDVLAENTLENITTAITKLLDQQNSIQKDLAIGFETVCDSGQISLLTEDMTSIKSSVASFQGQIEKIEGLRQDNVRLQERTKSDAAIRQIIENSCRSAELRHVEVQKNNNKLIASLTSVSETDSRTQTRRACELETQLSTVTTRWNCAAKELGEAKTSLEAYESQLTETKSRLHEVENSVKSNEDHLRAHFEEQLAELKTENTAEQIALKVDFDSQLQIKNETITAGREALHEAQSQTASAKREITLLIAANKAADESLSSIRIELSASTQKLKLQEAKFSKLSEEHGKTRRRTDTIKSLEQHIAEKQLTIKNLVVDADKLKQAREQADILRNVISQLEERLEKSNQNASRTCELERELLDCQQKLQAQITQTDVLEDRCKASDRVKQDLDQRMIEISRIETLLKASQDTCRRLQNIESEKEILEKEVNATRKELAKVSQSSDHTSKLEEQNREKDSIIDKMKLQLRQAFCSEKNLGNATDMPDEKDDQSTSEKGHASKLQNQATHHIDAPNASGGDLDEVFTQDTNLSITTQSHSRDQNDVFDRNQDLDASTMPGNEPQWAIHPRVIMPATPNVSHFEAETPVRKDGSQMTIILDSQLDRHAELHDGLRIGVGLSTDGQGVSSPLSDVDEDFFDTSAELTKSDPKRKRTTSRGVMHHHNEHDVYDIPVSSPQPPNRYRVSRTLSRQPSSVASHEEMLLQASEIGRLSGPSKSTSRRTRRRLSIAYIQDSSPQHSGRRSAKKEIILHRPASSSDTQEQTQQDVLIAGALQGMSPVAREKNLPNSAIKRRIENTATEVNDRFSNKRLRSGSNRTVPGTRDKSYDDSNAASASRSSHDRSASRRSRSVVADGSATAKNKSKRSKTTRKAPKQDRYAARFGDNSQN